MYRGRMSLISKKSETSVDATIFQAHTRCTFSELRNIPDQTNGSENMASATKKMISLAAGGSIAALSGMAHAARPEDKGIALQPPATSLAEQVHFFHNVVLMPVIVFISLFVLALLIWVCVRYNRKANPEPSKFSHNTLVEVIWTGVPIAILLYIALFSFDLLYTEGTLPDGKKETFVGDGQVTEFVFANDFQPSRIVTRYDHVDVFRVSGSGEREKLKPRADFRLAGLGDEAVTVALEEPLARGAELEVVAGRSRVGPTPFLGLFGEDRSEIITEPTITIKATGFQWGWAYNYPDYGDFELTALLMPEDQVADPRDYLLAATEDVVVPEGEVIRVITAARDVIHSWAMPAFALKIDAVPGRLNETWFKAPAPGMYYGQCSEICGKDHAFMPISLRSVPAEEFEAWVDEQREANGMEPLFDGNDQLASATEPTAAQ